MIVSESAGVLFVHVQKTGGQTVANLLLDLAPGARKITWMRDNKHATLHTILDAKPEYADYFVCGFVRNPWARMLSWHEMVLRRSADRPDRLAENGFWRGTVER